MRTCLSVRFPPRRPSPRVSPVTAPGARATLRWAGYALLYEDRYPYAGGPGYYAMYGEDPDRIKVEVVAPGEG